MRPAVRAAVVDLLRQAPDDADRASMMPAGGPDPERTFFLEASFLEASTWPDVVRDRDEPQRRERYRRGHWHYVNHFWASTPDGPLPLSHLDAAEESATERLLRFAETVADASVPGPERAVQRAGMLHLVGDLHQPLHASSRVRPAHPEGDKGGGSFRLGGEERFGNLHVCWDGILDRSYPRRAGESSVEYALRLARRLPQPDCLDSTATRSGPTRSGPTRSGPTGVAVWTRESAEIAQLAVCLPVLRYLPVLREGAPPPEICRRHAPCLSEGRLQLAGLRLAALRMAALLNHLFR